LEKTIPKKPKKQPPFSLRRAGIIREGTILGLPVKIGKKRPKKNKQRKNKKTKAKKNGGKREK